MRKLFQKKNTKPARHRTALANKSMLSIEALEKRVMLAADFQTVTSGGDIWIEARGTEFQDRFTVVEDTAIDTIKIIIDFEIDAVGNGIGDFGEFSGGATGDGIALDLKSLTFGPGMAVPGANPGPGDADSAFFDSIEATYDLNLLEFAAAVEGKTFTGVRVNQGASPINSPLPGTDGTADHDLISLHGVRDYDDDQFTLNGGTGDDIIKGGLQGDIINGGDGDDSVFFADNEDTIRGEAGHDSVRYGLHSFGAEDDDIPADDVEFVRGTNFDDTIDLTNNPNDVTIIGLGGDDTLVGGSGHDDIYGDDVSGGSAVAHDDITASGPDGDDNIVGNAGDDDIHGGGGNDLIHGNDGEDLVHGDDGMDHIFGDADNDILYGDDGDDHIDGGTGDDSLIGGAGDDTLVGGGGTDSLDGGAGAGDTADFRATLGPVEVDLLAGIVAADGNGGTGVIAGVENVLGSDTAVNKLYGDGADNVLRGGSADDTIVGRDGADTLIGKDGNDLLGEFGDARANTSEGAGGTFERGDDLLLGGLGDDSLRGGYDNDTIKGDGDLDDEVTSSWVIGGVTVTFDDIDFGASEVILEPGGNDTIEGDGWYATLADPIVHLPSGNDRLDGNSGDDILYASDAKDPFDDVPGLIDNAAPAPALDILNGDAGNDKLFGHAGVDSLFGDLDQAAIDNPLGGGGDDILFGLDGPDFLFGGNGSDTLVGGLGVDDLNGGSGGTFDGNDILQIEAIGNELVDRSAFAGTLDGDRYRIVSDSGVGVEGIVPVAIDATTRPIITAELDQQTRVAGDIFSDLSDDDDVDFTDVSESGLTDALGSPLFVDVNNFG